MYIASYVDDLFLMERSLERIKKVKRGLLAEFNMKDLGEAKLLLGIEIRRHKNGDVYSLALCERSSVYVICL